MKFIGRLWTALVNFLLILLPVVLLSQFLYIYREPIAKQFKQFLGDPVAETVATVETLEDQSPTPTHLQEVLGYFRQLNAREELNEPESRRVTDSLFRLHNHLIDFLRTGPKSEELNQVETVYLELLETGLLDQLFTQPRRVSQELSSDWKRVKAVLKIPAHPTEGLDTYLNHSDTVAGIIRSYSRVYSGQFDCPDVYQRECDTIFSTSLEASAEQTTKYFTTWPKFSANLIPRMKNLRSILSELTDTLTGLVQSTAKHLELSPWTRYDQLRENHAGFSKRFKQNAARFYGRTLSQFELTPAEFDVSGEKPAERKLRALKQVEETISQNEATGRLVLNRRNQQLRTDLTDRLSSVYHRVRVQNAYDPTFKTGTSTIGLFEQTLGSMPSGEARLKQEKETFTRINSYNQQLESALQNQDYSKMTEVLAELKNARISEQNRPGWEIMVEHFLRSRAPTFTSPDWQPGNDESRAAYFKLIKLVGKTGNQLGIDQFSRDWVQETILTVRSRRFRELRDWIVRNLTSTGLNNNVGQLKARLRELTQLEDLPGHLADRPVKIIRDSIYLERIITGGSRLHDSLFEIIDASQTRKDWRVLGQILDQLNRRPTVKEVLDSKPLRLSRKIQSWFDDKFTGETGQLIAKQLKSKLRAYFQNLTEDFLGEVNEPESASFSTGELIRVTGVIDDSLDNLQEGLKPAGGIDWTAYGNLLELRNRLVQLNDAADELSAGSLLGENITYGNFRELTSEFELTALPGSYNYRYEDNLLEAIHETLINRAVEFNQASEGEWFRGWGGRLTGREVVKRWLDFLTHLDENIQLQGPDETLGRLLDESQKILRKLDDQQ